MEELEIISKNGNFDLNFILYTKKKIIQNDLRPKCKAIKRLEKNRRKFGRSRSDDGIFRLDPSSLVIKEKINKLDLTKI